MNPIYCPDALRRAPLRGPRTVLMLAAAAMVLLAAPVAGAGPAAANTESPGTESPDTVQWSVVPADEDGPDDRISLRHEVEPGTTIEEHIAVTNLGDTDAQFSIAAGDGRVGRDGAFDLAQGEAVAAGSWVAIDGLDDGEVSVPAGESAVLPITITVPQEATPGDHPAGIVAGISSDATGVSVTHRVGVRLHLRVAGEIEPALDVQVLDTSYSPSLNPLQPGTLSVRYAVTNTGNVRLGASPVLAAAGPFGLLGTRQGAGGVGELLPTGTQESTAEIPMWPLVWVSGDFEVAGVAVAADQIPLPDSHEAPYSVLAVSWTTTGVLVLVLGLVVLAIVRRRRRKRLAAAN